MTEEAIQPPANDEGQEATPPSESAQPMNRAERRALAQGKKGAKGNPHTVNLPGAARPGGTTRGAIVPPQQHTRSSNRGK